MSGHPVVPGQPLVHEREVGVEQIDDADDLRARSCGTAARSPAGTTGAGSRRSPASRACAFFSSRRNSHCPAKLLTSASARGSASSRRTCRSSTAGFFSCPRIGDLPQLVVGNAAPQEERQTRGQLEIGQAERRARRDAGRLALESEQELRIDQHARHARAGCRCRTIPFRARSGRSRAACPSRCPSPAPAADRRAWPACSGSSRRTRALVGGGRLACRRTAAGGLVCRRGRAR